MNRRTVGRVRAVEGTVTEHGHEDPDPTVGDTAEGSAMLVASSAELSVVRPRCRVAGGTDPCPVIEGIPETLVAPAAHEDDPALAAASGDGGRAAVRAERLAVPLGQERRGFGQERSDRDGTEAGNGAEDLEVTRSVAAVVLIGELVQQGLEVLETALPLLVGNPEAGQKEPHVPVGSLDRAGSGGHARLPEGGEHVIGIETSDAVAFQDC